MNKPISPELLAKLRDAEGEGLSHDPKNNPPKIIRLLQDKDEGSKWCPSGARAGQYLIGDTLSDDFIWTPVKFQDTFIEWTVDPRRYVATHHALPHDAKWDAKKRYYLRANRNSVEKQPRSRAYQRRSVHAEFQSERTCRSAQNQLGCQ